MLLLWHPLRDNNKTKDRILVPCTVQTSKLVIDLYFAQFCVNYKTTFNILSTLRLKLGDTALNSNRHALGVELAVKQMLYLTDQI